MVKISDALGHRIRTIFPEMEDELKLAQMRETPEEFIKKVALLSFIFTLNFTVVVFIILLKVGSLWLIAPFFLFFLALFTLIFLQIPKMNIARVRKGIEEDIFIPSRMLLTLLESGSSIVLALERVGYSNAKSSKFFGMIASRINLGKPIAAALDESVRYTPSESFRRVLHPIRKSLLTGTDVRKNLEQVLEDMIKEKAIEIERYEKKLGALSLFYMIFGVIIPAVSVIIVVVVLSLIGMKVTFFPFLLILLVLTLMVHFAFIRSFQNIRPLMRE